MNKSELLLEVERKLEQMGYPVKSSSQIQRVFNAIIETVQTTVASGEGVQITGFGKFYAYDMRERKGRNIVTGESVNIPAKRVPKFKAGITFKNLLK